MRPGLSMGWLLVLAGCFRPELDRCAIRCEPGEACPSGMSCGADLRCHAAGEPADCAADDAGAPDAPLDGGGPSTPVIALGAGNNHSCAVLESGALHCWGSNVDFQLGVTTATTRVGTPVEVDPGPWSQVDGGAGHTCGIAAGALLCWGRNATFQTGTPSPEDVEEPELVDDTIDDWFDVCAGFEHSCGIHGDPVAGGTIRCWGNDADGQLGDGIEGGARQSADPIDSAELWIDVECGSFHTCAINATGEAYCWGKGDHGELGDNLDTESATPVPVADGHSFRELGLGTATSCGTTDGAELYCWGDNSSGQLGVVTGGEEHDPILIDDETREVVLALLGGCAIGADGVVCWGEGGDGELGDGSFDFATGEQREVDGAQTATRLVSGARHRCALGEGGEVWCWGANDHGQLADRDVAFRDTPTRIGNEVGWDRIAAGRDHSCGIRDGELRCWGRNDVQQAGIDGPNPTTPAPIEGPASGWLELGVGLEHTCALRDDGGDAALWCWGSDDNERLGNGDDAGDRLPGPVDGGETGWTGLAVGPRGGCGLVGDARHCWGDQTDGQLGDGDNGGVQPAPLLVGDGEGWSTVSLGDHFGCGVRADQLECWGTDVDGRQGRGADDDASTTPVTTSAALTWTSISASTGGGHACALLDGVPHCWGNNQQGQVGNNSTTDADAPVLVTGGLTSWSVVAVGTSHSCGLHSASLYCWGNNSNGQLGTPSVATSTSEPTPVGALTWSRIATGRNHTCGLTDEGGLYCWGTNRHGELGVGSTYAATPQLVEP